jgi:hypothetical protein
VIYKKQQVPTTSDSNASAAEDLSNLLKDATSAPPESVVPNGAGGGGGVVGGAASGPLDAIDTNKNGAVGGGIANAPVNSPAVDGSETGNDTDSNDEDEGDTEADVDADVDPDADADATVDDNDGTDGGTTTSGTGMENYTKYDMFAIGIVSNENGLSESLLAMLRSSGVKRFKNVFIMTDPNVAADANKSSNLQSGNATLSNMELLGRRRRMIKRANNDTTAQDGNDGEGNERNESNSGSTSGDGENAGEDANGTDSTTDSNNEEESTGDNSTEVRQVLVSVIHTLMVDPYHSSFFRFLFWIQTADRIFPSMKSLYDQFPNANWYLIIQDSTYVFPENLRLAVENLDPNADYYFGAPVPFMGCQNLDVQFNSEGEGPSFAQGTSGVLLSQGAMKKFAGVAETCVSKYQEWWV